MISIPQIILKKGVAVAFIAAGLRRFLGKQSFSIKVKEKLSLK